jgi:predicted TIM-barrel fold metal-dependent hydrolase
MVKEIHSVVKEKNKRKFHIYFHHSLEELEQFSHRVMFGSDYPVAMNDLEKIYACVQKMDISLAAKRNITENTAKNFISKFKPNLFDETVLKRNTYSNKRKGGVEN